MTPRRSGRRLADAARRILGHPREAGAILWARLTGKRLRARQRLAALIGIDHRLALPARILGRFPLASEAPGDDIRLIGDGTLVAGAPARIAGAFAADPGLQALYGDALVQERPGGPVLPLLPPVFDADRLAAFDDLGPVLAYRRTALDSDLDPVSPADAAFRIAERHGARAIGHLPEILSIRREDGDPLAPLVGGGAPKLQPERGEHPGAGEGGQIHHRVVASHLDRTGRSGARIAAAPDGLLRVEDPLPDPPPLASLIVPTRDRLDLLRPCLESLRRCTDWPSIEILVCDNDSREPETLAYLIDLEREGRGHVVPCPGPFNFAAMNNAAAARARGRLLVFVNNDVEAFRPDWLTLMARQALRPDVGAVGAKLLDGAGRIQHGGIVLGTGGLVTHGHRHFPGDAPGYRAALRVTHAVSAVTAACLVVEAEKFRAVGGFDDAAFAVDFNDVDLCLRLNAAGYRTLLVPEAVLYHREAASRRWTPEARARHAREIAALKTRWGPLLAQDPHYHPGFDPDLSTHARLRSGFPAAGTATIRRPPA
ncbi:MULTISPECIES: glycosyltransferase [unclassified Methylobacterium]|jgi:GT2 family glycosyltransferase|uniref:glycosyltransferase n=1 Tax=unclassified Methylobacterium TaxID=2615210 RepID=UPI0013527D29|nr:glycosyltransferase [Methylobacterium sp. 2A]MWV24261.1 glycosyltransferase [Methylobacterium sp. 2A]